MAAHSFHITPAKYATETVQLRATYHLLCKHVRKHTALNNQAFPIQILMGPYRRIQTA